ncbi:MAG: sugar transferase, partial [Pseudomonadota bacterium]
MNQIQNITSGKAGLSSFEAIAKRCFDIIVSTVGLALLGWLIILSAIAARIDTGKSGIFRQKRIGRYGREFTIYKIRTMRDRQDLTSTSTVAGDPRITSLGKWLRKYKLDELPQLWNVLRGDMSLVGPRPDVANAYSNHNLDLSLAFAVRPGITGPASLAYRHEEELLAQQEDPEWYASHVLMPEKLRLNEEYI